MQPASCNGMRLKLKLKISLSWLLTALLWPQASLANEDELGRLFFDAKQREEIMRRYRQAQNAPELTEAENLQQLPMHITVNGLVLRSQGENTVWIDQQTNPQQDGLHGLRVDIDEMPLRQISVPVFIHSSEIQTYVKPGQSMDTLNGQVIETYESTLSKTTQKNP